MENKELDLAFVNIANAKSRSLEKSRNQVKGAMYVTHDIVKKKKVEQRVKLLLAALSLTFVAGMAGLIGTTQASDEIMKEVIQHDDPEFKEDMQELNDFELHKLFNDTHKEMMEESGEYGPAIVEDVVARMEQDHDQKTSMSK